MKTTRRDIIGFIRGIEGLFSSEFSADSRLVLERNLSDYSIPVLTKVFRSLETGTLQLIPNPKEVISICKAANGDRTNHAYELGRKYRITNRTGNPYEYLEMRGKSCTTLLLHFQKGYSEADTDLTLSVS